jgi:3',5'-cyclic AMP phosphodiesterase CpdA
MMEERVMVASRPGLHVVRLDSTAPHNRALINGHGHISESDVRQVEEALGQAPEGSLKVVMLHHHVLPLPVEDIPERIIDFLGHPCADELRLGEEMLRKIVGRCRLVLHGHRHVPAEFHAEADEPLWIYNAGSTTSLMKCRLFAHSGGEVLWEAWLSFDRVRRRSWAPSFIPTASAV